jgi:hypothetical protein
VSFYGDDTQQFWKETGLWQRQNCGDLEGKMEREGTYYLIIIQL